MFLLDKFTLSPFLGKLADLDTQIEFNEKKYEKTYRIDTQKDTIIQDYLVIKPYVEIGKTEEDALAAIMKKVEEMAYDCEITLLNMKPETEKKAQKKDHRIKQISLDIEGFQSSIVKFLYKLENSGYSISIDKLDFDIKNRETGLIEASIEISFIFFVSR